MIWTICFLIDTKRNRACLGQKKRGHGKGFWNGFGGKKEFGEKLETTIKREAREELGIDLVHLTKCGSIKFIDTPSKSVSYATVYICTSWKGTITESEELRPKWFNLNAIPYNSMWSADRYWIPLIIEGKTILASFTYNGGDSLQSFKVKIV